eukprot:4685497-Pleurochrysis_carterae.AAC.1
MCLLARCFARVRVRACGLECVCARSCKSARMPAGRPSKREITSTLSGNSTTPTYARCKQRGERGPPSVAVNTHLCQLLLLEMAWTRPSDKSKKKI